MSFPLLSFKLYIHSARLDGVFRPHLTEKLAVGLHKPRSFLLLSAPAGLGKILGRFEWADLARML